jgi:hypothetical protein
MPTVVRVLGIVAASMVLGLSALFLLLLAVCGSNAMRGWEGLIVVIPLLLCGGSLVAIVALARGMTTSARTQPGLAVPPAPRAAPARRPGLRGSDFQRLFGLRALLGLSVMLAGGGIVLRHIAALQVAPEIVRQGAFAALVAGCVLAAPAGVLLALLRDPPTGLILDLIVGLAAGSMGQRVLSAVAASLAWTSDPMETPAVLMRLVVFSSVEAGSLALAWRLRRGADAGPPQRWLAAAGGFAAWAWIGQALSNALYRPLS